MLFRSFIFFLLYIFALILSDAVCPWVFFVFLFLFFYFFFLLSLFCVSFPILSIIVRKTRSHRTSTSSSTPSFDSERFISEKKQETYKKLNIFRFVWAERKVVLDELDPEIRKNFERRGWLPLMDIDHPPP